MLLALCAIGTAPPALPAPDAPASLADCDARRELRPDDLETYRCYYTYGHERLDYAGTLDRLDEIIAASTPPAATHARLFRARLASLRDVRGSTAMLQQCAEEYVASGDDRGEGWTRLYLAVNLMRLGRFDESTAAAEQAGEIAGRIDDFSLLAGVRYQQSRIAILVGDQARAWSLLRQLELSPRFEEMSPAFQVDVWDNLSMLSINLDLLDTAYDYARRELELVQKDNLIHRELNAWQQVGAAATRLVDKGTMDRAEALAALEHGRQLAEAGRDPLSGVQLFAIGTDEAHLRGGEEGIGILQGMLDSPMASSPYSAGPILHALGRLLFEYDPSRQDEAEEYLQRAVDAYVTTKQPQNIIDALHELTRVRLAGPDRQRGLETAYRTLDAIEEFQEMQSGERVGALGLARRAAVYYLLIAALLGPPDGEATPDQVDEAFQVSERLRSRALIEHLSRTRGAEEDSAEGRRRAEVLAAISARQLRLFTAQLDLEERERIAGELGELEEEEEMLRAALGRSDPALAAARPRELPSAAEIRGAIAADEAILSFLIAPDDLGGSRVLVSTSTETRAAPITRPVAEVEQAVRFWLGLLRRGDGTDGPGAARLYDDLLADAMRVLPPGVSRIIMIPDGVLHQLPFDALRASPGGPPLVRQYEISLAPSASVWLRLRREFETRAASAHALLLADPDFPRSADWPAAVRDAWSLDRPLGRLPHAREEVRNALRALGGNGELRIGADASEAFLKTADLEQFGVLHVAAHALTDEADPERSAILLTPGGPGEDGLLQPREVIDLDLGGGVVLLSACRTAGGEILAGEGVMSLARSFFEANASAVVASLWPLRDRETQALMDVFYRHLAAGASVASALAAAKRDLQAAGAPPSAWSGVVVLGAGDRAPWPATARAHGWLPTLLLVLGLALLTGFLVLRQRRLRNP